jgi:hypothetical protein
MLVCRTAGRLRRNAENDEGFSYNAVFLYKKANNIYAVIGIHYLKLATARSVVSYVLKTLTNCVMAKML